MMAFFGWANVNEVQHDEKRNAVNGTRFRSSNRTSTIRSRGTSRIIWWANSVVRAQFIAALLCGITVCLAASAQQNHNDGVRISCPLFLHSHPIKIVRPTYPELARQTHIEGRVSLNCLVGSNGLVEKIEVKKGHPLLIQAAMDAVSQWKFKPLLLNGKRVETETIVNIDFQLPKDQKNTSSTKPHG